MPAPRQPGRRVTLKDVAEHADVSVSTASLVFSGKGPVAEATAERVRASAAELGYAGPDPLAASLRHGRAGVIGAYVDVSLQTAFQDPYAVAVFDGLSSVIDSVDAGMLLLSGHVPSSQALDAMVFPLCAPIDPGLVERLASRRTPVVGTGLPQAPGAAHVRIDNAGPVAALTRRLRELGHTRIAHLTMEDAPDADSRLVDPRDLLDAPYPDMVERLEGFLAAAPAGAPVAVAGAGSIESAVAAADLLLDLDPRPTAVVAQSDLLAAGVVRAAEARGLRVPDDLSVTGFDGVDLPWLPHRLTTVDQDGAAKGRLLGEMAVALIAGEPVADRVQPTVVVEGTTTAPPPR